MSSLRWKDSLGFVAFAAIVAAGCSASSASPTTDAGIDAGALDAAVEAATGGCTIVTCSGPVVVPPGGMVSMGDSCNTPCTCTCGGGFCEGGCSVSADCGVCGDGG
jgi:hypothetical protein